MRKAWIYSGRKNNAAADRLADELRADGVGVMRAATRFYHGETHDDADTVYHDGSDSRLARLDNAELFTGPAPKRAPATEPGYRVERAGAWFKLIGPDGQVGKSQRSEAAAWALLD